VKRATALKLIRRYTDEFKAEFGHINAHDAVLTELADRFPEDGSKNKAMRWLGFAQGVSYEMGMYSLDELKEHSREAISGEETEEGSEA
jgi:hypothetical protein